MLSGMDYYVSQAAPHSRARLHDASCSHCRDGQGQEGQHRTGAAMRWHGPFDTLAKAEQFMARQFGHYKDTGKCGHCKPGVDL